MDSSPLSIEIRQRDVEFLHDLLRGELQRARALVEIDNLRAKTSKSAASSSATAPLIRRLHEYPADGVDLENLVVYPPQMEAIPVKPLFFDVAWNYIDYPGRGDATSAQPAAKAQIAHDKTPTAQQQQQQQQKKGGWFGFGRS
jgi:signal recognition particle subunit SRP68